mmetsp:Transcript_20142/g.42634  ORF Transcript_20142/g.42634 Transcript_20142/m.42634 type:complete len:397 (+) Transcript_20142:139-1329(+)
MYHSAVKCLMAVAAIAATCNAFATTTSSSWRLAQQRIDNNGDVMPLRAAAEDDSWSSPASADASSSSAVSEKTVLPAGIVLHEKLVLRDPNPEERGKGGVEVVGEGGIKALEVLARIPRDLIVSTLDVPDRAIEAASGARNLTWATDLTAATLAALHPTEEELAASASTKAKKEWISSWKAGGWATDGIDLGPSDVNFGSKDVTGSLLATGTDNDHNIYAKFRMPCHPVLLRSSLGLKVLTQCTEEEGREALVARGFTYRSMRDALEPLILESTERPKGSKREKRCWDVADTLSRVLSRGTSLQLEESNDGEVIALAYAIVPLHERLEHSVQENSKLVANNGDEILLVATRDIDEGEAITRDYNSSPKLLNDKSEGSLRLLLQFGLPPKAWPTSPN